jgi:hypothetical protein
MDIDIHIYTYIYISYTSQVLDPSGNIEDLHPSAYVSTRQHTSAHVSIRQHPSAYPSGNIEEGSAVALLQHALV